MCDTERLLGYLYDEITPAERADVERHLTGCPECQAELTGLRAARGHLALWAPPEPDFGFQVVRQRRPSWRSWWRPAAGLAAAAVLVLAAAAAVAHVEVRYDRDGFVVRTGWQGASAPVPVRASAAPPDAAVQRDAALGALDQRLTMLEAGASKPASVVGAGATQRSDAELLRRVRLLVADSESRQQHELAIRVAGVMRDVDLQRVTDLTRIQQGMGRIEGLTSADQVQHRQVMDLLTRVAQQR